jgi:TPR repeat protein
MFEEIITLHENCHNPNLSLTVNFQRLIEKLQNLDQEDATALIKQLRYKKKKMTSPLTMHLYALCNEHGIGSNNRKHKEAFKWYKKAAELKNPLAMYHLALRSDVPKALDLHTEAALAGNIFSMRSLGELYKNKNIDTSIEWYTKAANLGDQPSMYGLGSIYFEQKEYKKSMYFLTKLADLGDAKALDKLGDLNDKMGNDNESIKYYYRAYLTYNTAKDKGWSFQKVRNILRSHKLKIITHIMDLEKKNGSLKHNNNKLMTENNDLETELQYRPGGDGYLDAEEDYNLLSKAGTARKPPKKRRHSV